MAAMEQETAGFRVDCGAKDIVADRGRRAWWSRVHVSRIKTACGRTGSGTTNSHCPSAPQEKGSLWQNRLRLPRPNGSERRMGDSQADHMSSMSCTAAHGRNASVSVSGAHQEEVCVPVQNRCTVRLGLADARPRPFSRPGDVYQNRIQTPESLRRLRNDNVFK